MIRKTFSAMCLALATLATLAGLLTLAVPSAFAKDTKYFFCDYLGVYQRSTSNSPYKNDRPFRYTKRANNMYEGDFPIHSGPAFEMKLKDNILYGAQLEMAREQKGFYREKYNVYRLHIDTGLMIQSLVYYTNKEDYEKNFKQIEANNPHLIPYSEEPLKFIDKPLPKANYVKFGFDGSSYECREVSYLKYLFLNMTESLFQLLSAG